MGEVISAVLSTVPKTFVTYYMDDDVILLKTAEKHLNHFGLVL